MLTENTDGGGGLGSASSICTIDPKDNVSVLNNLINRIEKLEQALSQVLGANLHANSLSDISSQVGWVYGVEYMGVPGWIRTEAGTLIPPKGFTLSNSGFQMFNSCTGTYEDYHGVSVDSDGVLQFGFGTNGQISGCNVDNWNNAAELVSPDYYIYRQGVSMTTGTPYEAGRNITRYDASGLSDSDGFTIAVEVTNPGLYQVSVGGAWVITRTGNETGTYTGAEINTLEFQGSTNSRGRAYQQELNSITYQGGVSDPGIILETEGEKITLTHTFDLPAGAAIISSAWWGDAYAGSGTYASTRGDIYLVITRLGKGSI